MNSDHFDTKFHTCLVHNFCYYLATFNKLGTNRTPLTSPIDWYQICYKRTNINKVMNQTSLNFGIKVVRVHNKVFGHQKGTKNVTHATRTIHSDHLVTQFETILVHIFLHKNGQTTKLVPIERTLPELSIGTIFVV